jgi:hypothetical protein
MAERIPMQATETKINELRAIIADEQVGITERRAVAAHVVRLQAETVEDASPDDPEVVALKQPWPRDTAVDREIADQWSRVTNGRSVNGWSEADALAKTTERHRLRVLLALIVDECLHRLERLAACQAVIDSHLRSQGSLRNAALTAESLLAKVIPPDAVKWTDKGMMSVVRPPREYADLW